MGQIRYIGATNMVCPELPITSRCNSGRTKQAVLPVPVWAAAMTSLPERTAGIALSWIGVGVVYPASAMA